MMAVASLILLVVVCSDGNSGCQSYDAVADGGDDDGRVGW